MKPTILIYFLLLFLLPVALSAADKDVPDADNGHATVELPKNFEKQLENSSYNWMEKKINKVVYNAVKERTVSLEKISDYLFIEVIPNFAYRDETGDERLGEDLMQLLGKIKTRQDAVIMELSLSKLQTMGLPFKKNILDSLLFDKKYFKEDIEIIFFVEFNKLTSAVYNALKRNKNYQLLYNSKNRFYRVKNEKSSLLYLVHISNIAYEIVFSGKLFENVIKKHVLEVDFLFDVMEKYEAKIKKADQLSFDGRYIKGKNIFIDMWFLYKKTKGDLKTAGKIFKKALAGKKVNISGSEKK